MASYTYFLRHSADDDPVIDVSPPISWHYYTVVDNTSESTQTPPIVATEDTQTES
jgi:hypothetical protein